MPDYASFVYSTLGNAYQSQGDFSKAIKYHTQHLAIAKEVGNWAGEGRAYGNLGTCHMLLNEYVKAVAYFEAREEHPRRIRGPITDHELDHFRKARLQLRKAGGPNKENNEIYRSLTAEKLAVVRTWADRSLKDAHSAASVLTDEDLRCTIRLLHKGGETSDKPSD